MVGQVWNLPYGTIKKLLARLVICRGRSLLLLLTAEKNKSMLKFSIETVVLFCFAIPRI